MYSVIVPIYKVEKYLPQCIESILSQTYRDFELILVDDGSPDNCPAICDKYTKKDARIKVVHKKNGGLVSARKAGLEIAAGEYVCFVDGDDFISCDMLEKFENFLDEHKVDMICTGHSEYYNDDKIVAMTQKVENGFYNKTELKTLIYPQMLSVKPFFNFYVQPSLVTKCIKREILLDVYKYMHDSISLGEDAAVSYPSLLQANNVCFLDYSGYMYRQNLDSMTHTYDKKLYDKIKNLIVYLKAVEKTMGWQAGNQINEYAVYLLILAKNNEFKYSKSGTYRVKRNNMNRYLKDPIFKEALIHTKVSGNKNKFILFCFKNKFLLPIYLYESIAKARGRK